MMVRLEHYWLFGFPITLSTVQAEYGFSLDRINWLGTVTNVILLPFSLLVPEICLRHGIKRTVSILLLR